MNARSGRLICTLVLALGTAALGSGCVVHAEAAGGAEAAAPVVFTSQPTLVDVDGNIWVVQDCDYPVYYVDGDYWVIRDHAWYRSHTYAGGWAVVDAAVVPTTIVTRNHAMYVHFRGSATAKFRAAPRAGEGFAREDRPGVGNERKAEGEQPGNGPHNEGLARDEAAGPGTSNDRMSDGPHPGPGGKGGGPSASSPAKKSQRMHDKK